jgi:aminoglycoside phosphotransferase (APT) family kinase protein
VSAEREPLALDAPRAVREAEALDVPALEAYLLATIPGAQGPLQVEQFPAGFSNLTYALDLGGAAYVLRRPPFGAAAKGGHDMGREVRVLRGLAPTAIPVPAVVAACLDEGGPLDAPFYVMERRIGVIVRRELPRPLRGDPLTLRAMCEALVDQLADLHRVDVAGAGLTELGRPDGYVRRQVEGWLGRYERAKTDEVAAFDALGQWLLAHLPPERGAALIHNDFKFDNVMLDPLEPRRIVAILDWEMATVGDPLLDLGTTLAYWVQPDDDDRLKMLAFQPTWQPGGLTRAEVVARYAARTGRDVPEPHWDYGFGLLKNAVIAQQIYWRFKQGRTRDPRFAALGMVVQLLSEVGLEAVQAARL